MSILDDIIIHHPRKSRGGKKGSIYFTISKNKKEYESIKFYINTDVIEGIEINEELKLEFGSAKGNNYIWYLIISDAGYTLRQTTGSTSILSAIINFPFKYIPNKKMLHIPQENIKLHPKDKIIELHVGNLFEESEELKLK